MCYLYIVFIAAQSLGYDVKNLPEFIFIARNILPSNVLIQVPPNLVCKQLENNIENEQIIHNIGQSSYEMDEDQKKTEKKVKLENVEVNKNENRNNNKNRCNNKNEKETGNVSEFDDKKIEEDGSKFLLSLLESGARDLGGISPLDEVNPTYKFQKINDLKLQLQNSNYNLVQRLPVYEHHFNFLNDRVKRVIDEKYENFYQKYG